MEAIHRPKLNHWLWLSLIPLFFIMIAMAVPHLNDDLYWLDEEMTVAMSGGAHYGSVSIGEIFTRTSRDRWPPLHNLVIVVWAEFAGWSEFSTRYFSLLVGVLSVAIVYRAGTRIMSKRVGLTASFLFVFSSFYANYLHEARGYTLYVLLVALALWMYWHINTYNRPSLWQYGLLWFALVAQLYTHYVAMSFVAGLGVYHLFNFTHKPVWHKLTRTGLLALLAYAPWVAVAISSMLVERQFSRGNDALTIIQELLTDFGNGLGILVIILAIVAIGLRRNRQTIYFASLTLLTVVMALIMNVFANFLFHSRHIMLILPPLYLLLAVGIVGLYEHRARVGQVLAVFSVGLWAIAGVNMTLTVDFVGGDIPRSAMLDTLDTLAQCDQSNDSIIFYARPLLNQADSNRVFNYYMYGLDYNYAQIGALDDLTDFSTPQSDYDARAESLAESAEYMWYIEFPDMPQIEQVARVNAIFQSNYSYCAHVPIGSSVKAVVYSNRATLTCTSGEVVLDICDQILLRNSDDSSD